MNNESEISLRERIRLNLIDAMKNAGFNQVQLAENLSVSKGTVNNWIRGNNSPDVDMVPRICKVLGISILDLYRPREKETSIGLDFGNSSMAHDYSHAALQLARDYDGLDRWGKQAVRDLADTELARMEDEARFREEAKEPQEPKVINLYLEPSAAGIASPVEGRDYTVLELGPDDPQGAAYAVRLQGDSMEPDFPDGSIVFVNHDALADGDIGIFSVDGGTVCKQYHRDGLGMVYLLSINRARSDADVVIPPSSNQTLVCQGRVITRKRYPIPGLWK